MPALLALPVAGHAPGLIDRQRRGDKQQQEGGAGVKHRGWAPQPAKVATGKGCRRRNVAQAVKGLYVEQQDDGGNDVDQEFEQNPVMPEQAPDAGQ